MSVRLYSLAVDVTQYNMSIYKLTNVMSQERCSLAFMVHDATMLATAAVHHKAKSVPTRVQLYGVGVVDPFIGKLNDYWIYCRFVR